ncbi:AmmeMemoRadiSam system protein B [Prolixibacter sp. SD074]|uniref:AmmeMemoRadiSam system protein B n=1 Tax=Prolixibacter sp. SD074 TaxID=2652391 RepID=UPI00127BC677|nr:AmmeMemoRadiSam system protein B [Prolixibacter sp. SD074]GET29157.1 MEMO1 family protein [Prolixibacter sp. SD074]
MAETVNRVPVAAGRFYSGSPNTLKKEVHEFLSSGATLPETDRLVGLIVPHAGYVFSGGTAGKCYARIPGKNGIERVVLIGSSHYASFRGASIYNIGNYETPLGVVPVDWEICERLIENNDLFSFHPAAHSEEHSLEVQLPFLQEKLKSDFRIVPILLGHVHLKECKLMANQLISLADEKTLFVISTDLSHYPGYEDARLVDAETIEAIASGEPEKFIDGLDRNNEKHMANLETSCCGWTSVLTFLYLAKGMKNVVIRKVDYSNSGDSAYGDRERVVGYGGLEAVVPGAKTVYLNEEEKAQLKKLAEEAIWQYFERGGRDDIDPEYLPPALHERYGVFVTVYVGEKLRGCLGRFDEKEPLYERVRDLAIASATRDTRFAPLNRDELKNMRIEISVLTPLKRIHDPSEIILGKHGIYIRNGLNTGTFLPQVATDHHWSVEEFLGYCSKNKAHLGWDGWRSSELFVFESVVID